MEILHKKIKFRIKKQNYFSFILTNPIIDINETIINGKKIDKKIGIFPLLPSELNIKSYNISKRTLKYL